MPICVSHVALQKTKWWLLEKRRAGDKLAFNSWSCLSTRLRIPLAVSGQFPSIHPCHRGMLYVSLKTDFELRMYKSRNLTQRLLLQHTEKNLHLSFFNPATTNNLNISALLINCLSQPRLLPQLLQVPNFSANQWWHSRKLNKPVWPHTDQIQRAADAVVPV